MPPRLNLTDSYSSNIEIFNVPDSASLTPRTPYSQSAQAEEGRTGSRRNGPVIPVNETINEDEDNEEMDEIDLLQTQSHPLLHRSTTESRSRYGSDSTENAGRSGNWKRGGKTFLFLKNIWRQAGKRGIPIGLILGCGAAALLLLLIVMSVKRPDTLMSYAGVNTTAILLESLDEESRVRFNGSTVIDYGASNYTSFPLTTDQYVSQCWKVIGDPRMKYHVEYWATRPGADLDVLHLKSTSTPKTCSSSITYILDGSVGLFADLGHLAQVAAFARERNRTLFVYDEKWNRGKWTDHFLPFSETQPGPEPGCTPPPPQELVACPRTARHWVTSAHIAFFHMGDIFADTYENAYKYTIERKRPIFDRAAESFATAFKPNPTNQRLIQRTRDEILHVATKDLNMTVFSYITTHIRRGDRKAASWRYQKGDVGHNPNWVEIDNKGSIAPIWNAFEFF
ncbi:hypothetical protein M422DRAFT_35556 [Sphaerobolus stellatus SS14]|uniref:Uncharacterized protein n=1 Tax=Sphaerobolus stellatus (strain SS14) TaxID=990650 RepID=A0A0C9V6U0_SPHS4|nr:hypothetical protein M422DRAFT_35556 [Sphaerobolus stellatus SS14]